TLVRELEATAIYVTHDQVEAMTLADRICIMRAGRVLQISTPREAYEKPATSFVASFLGSPKMNLLSAEVRDGEIHAGPFRIPARDNLPKTLELGIRPEDIRIVDGGMRAEIVILEPLGAE